MIDIASLIPSIAGLGVKIGTAVPGLRKPRKQDTAGAVARTAGAQFGGAVGAAQTGHGASRGLALREGLRQGVNAVGQQSAVIAQAAERDAAANEANMQARNQRIAGFGGDLAKGLGDMAAIAVGPKSGGDAAARPEVDVNPETGFGTPQAEGDVGNQGLGDLEAAAAEQEQVDQQQLIDEAGAQLEDFKLKREAAGISAAPEQKAEPETTAALIDQAYSTQPAMAPAIEKQLAQTLHLKQLAYSEMERTGSNFGEMIPRLNRRLGLSAGQTLQNPFAMDLDVTGEV